MCPWAIYREVGEAPDWFKKRARPVLFDDVTKEFIRFHNIVNANRQPEDNVYAATAKCHPTVVVGIEGMRYFCGPETDRPMAMKHMGNVILGEHVDIGPYTVIHRGTIGSTVIGNCVKIGSFVNIGHNVVIGEKTAITPFVCIGGSTRIGPNCWIGMHSVIRDNIEIGEGIKIGMGSQVVKDIQEPGVYYGTPATRRGDWDGVW
jgi:UDP-3-O-[3-hydroxymyristoyl] glucosamine N-acyltransferase LpxD